jgi:hypothetical protein
MLVSRSLVGPRGYSSEGIKLEKESQGRITYRVNWINTSDNPSDEFNKYFKASFIVAGKTAPEVKPTVDGEGLDISSYDFNLLTLQLTKWFILFLFIYILVLVFTFDYFGKRNKNRLTRNAVDKLTNLSQGKDASLSLVPDEIPEIVDTVLSVKLKKEPKELI